MIDLGKYAVTVLSAYGVSLALLALIVLMTIRQSAQARRKIAQLEEQKRG